MLEYLSDKIAKVLVSQKIISDCDMDVYAYGLSLLLSFFFNTVIMFVIGIITHRLVETILFLIVFVILRSFSGGYHADTFLKCMIITFSTYALVIGLSAVKVSLIVYLAVLFAGFFIVLIKTPIEHPNKEISVRDKKHHKITSVILYTAFSGLGVVLDNYNTRFKSTIFFALLTVIVLLFIKESTKGDIQNG